MKDFLIKSGFELKQYPDGLFWVLYRDPECFIQLNEDYSQITLYEDGWVENNLTKDELIKALKQIKERGQTK